MKTGSQLKPAQIAVIVGFAVAVIGGLGWFYMSGSTASGPDSGKAPSQAPGLPRGMKPPPTGGATVKPGGQ